MRIWKRYKKGKRGGQHYHCKKSYAMPTYAIVRMATPITKDGVSMLKVHRGSIIERAIVQDPEGKIRMLSRPAGGRTIISSAPITEKSNLGRFGLTKKDIIDAVEADYAEKAKREGIKISRISTNSELEELLKKKGYNVL